MENELVYLNGKIQQGDLTVSDKFQSGLEEYWNVIKHQNIILEQFDKNPIPDNTKMENIIIIKTHAPKMFKTHHIIDGYTLVSGIISCSSTGTISNHAIVGVLCRTNGKYYIYDSNNFITQDNWHTQDYTNYLTSAKENYTQYPQFSVLGCCILVYVKN